MCVRKVMQPKIEKWWHQDNESPAMIDTAGPSNTTAAPVADLFITHIRLVMYLFCSVFSSPSPPIHTLFSYADWKQPQPAPLPLEFTGSLPQHGNGVIKRKKQMVLREKVCKRAIENTVLCYSHIHKTLSTLHSATPQGRASNPSQLPACCCCCCSELWGGDVIACNVSLTESDSVKHW